MFGSAQDSIWIMTPHCPTPFMAWSDVSLSWQKFTLQCKYLCSLLSRVQHCSFNIDNQPRELLQKLTSKPCDSYWRTLYIIFNEYKKSSKKERFSTYFDWGLSSMRHNGARDFANSNLWDTTNRTPIFGFTTALPAADRIVHYYTDVTVHLVFTRKCNWFPPLSYPEDLFFYLPPILTGAENVAERLKGFFRNHICSEQNIVDTAAFCNGAMNK